MASKKYVIQPLSLPPPTRLRAHNGSRSQPVLAKNSKSLLALGPSDLKKKEKESLPAALPFSPFTPYDHKDLDTKYAQERIVEDAKEQPPVDLETDLKFLRDYLKNEKKFATFQVSSHPFQYIDEHDDDAEENMDGASADDSADFKSWIRDMNTKLHIKKREIRTDKKNAAASQQDQTNSTDLSTSSLSSPLSSPTTSPNTSTTKKSHFSVFTLGRKKKKKEEEEYDAIDPGRPRRITTVQSLSTNNLKQSMEEPVKFGRVFSLPQQREKEREKERERELSQANFTSQSSSSSLPLYTPSFAPPSQPFASASSSSASQSSSSANTKTFKKSNSSSSSISSSSDDLSYLGPPSIPPASDNRLFQVVRPALPQDPDDTQSQRSPRGIPTPSSSPRGLISSSLSSLSSSSTSQQPQRSPRGLSSSSSSIQPPTTPRSPRGLPTSTSSPALPPPASPTLGKSKSFSFRARLMPSNPKPPTHQSEHDMRTKKLPRNVVSVGIAS